MIRNMGDYYDVINVVDHVHKKKRKRQKERRRKIKLICIDRGRGSYKKFNGKFCHQFFFSLTFLPFFFFSS